MWSLFRPLYRILQQTEGANDGLVSVSSSKWGEYRGTLINVSHLELINWTNRMKWIVGRLVGNKRKSVSPYFTCPIVNYLGQLVNEFTTAANRLEFCQYRFNAVAFYLGVAGMI